MSLFGVLFFSKVSSPVDALSLPRKRQLPAPHLLEVAPVVGQEKKVECLAVFLLVAFKELA